MMLETTGKTIIDVFTNGFSADITHLLLIVGSVNRITVTDLEWIKAPFLV